MDVDLDDRINDTNEESRKSFDNAENSGSRTRGAMHHD